jgi:alpha-mannosidase
MNPSRPASESKPGPLSRRKFLRNVSGGSGALLLGQSAWIWAEPKHDGVPLLYYMDGYHGGVRGHMPGGCWRDIVEAMDHNPEWKLSLDVEASSWSVLERQDPSTLSRVAAFLKPRGGATRMEMTGGTFSQPYGWAISGESNIRQLQRGLDLIRQQFPELRVETYAVQEPCWASCLPQILLSLGFTGASLKNASTAWGGYTRGMDAELVNWTGPDGSSILAAPRYVQERLLNVWETEATEVTPDYVQRCVDHGIPQPAGMCFQDLGWAAQPRVKEPWVRFATWREYLHTIANAKPVNWAFTMEDILTALPWGEKTLHRVSRQVREAEVQMIRAEKCAAMHSLYRGAAWPEEPLRQAWDQTMLSQAHDAWITATTRSGRQAWAFQVASDTLEAADLAQELIDKAASGLCAERTTAGATSDVQFVCAVNTLGRERTDLIEMHVAADRGTVAFEVVDAHGKPLPCQMSVLREFRTLDRSDGLHTPIMERELSWQSPRNSINAATLLIRDQLPAFGWKTYKVTALRERKATSGAAGLSCEVFKDGNVLIETDLYRIRFDAQRGGAIASLYVKELRKEFCAEGKLMNEFRGFFAQQGKWHSSSESAAEIKVHESGPLRARLECLGTIGGCPFRSLVTVTQGQARIDCEVTFDFKEGTYIGDPWDIRPEDRMKERRRSSNDGRPKLQAIFPAALDHGVIDKSGAFDVCRSRNASTHFQRWDDIKHNIITNWVDLLDERQQAGLAIFSDRTTAYSYGEGEPLGLILGWGGEAGYWWGRSALRGEQKSRYAVLPHRGDWRAARLWQENNAFEEAIVVQVMPGAPDALSASKSLLRLSPPEAAISSVTVSGGALLVRIFLANTEEGSCRLELGFKARKAELVELDGRVIKELPLQHHEREYSSLSIEMPPFSIRTLRIIPAQP